VASYPITLFDLISVFGLASFFAWLAFAPLQSDQLEKFKGKNRKKAGRNFAAINDYFLVSFLGYALAATCDYLSQITNVPYLGILTAVIYLGIFAGVTGLLWAMMYVRLIVKAEKTWYSVNPPDFIETYVLFGATLALVYFAVDYASKATFSTDRFLWICEIGVVAWSGWQAIRYHDERNWKERGKRRGMIGLTALFLTPIVLGNVVIPLLRLLETLLAAARELGHSGILR
jgi:hypothetical protein